MVVFRRRSAVVAAKETVSQIGTPPPTNPAELGLSLRAARERRKLSLEEVRDLVDIPVVDLDALERGQLELFHLQQAAVVALWRYAALLGLDAEGLLPVLQQHWPHRSLSVGSLSGEELGATPVAKLTAAARLLAPMLRPQPALGSATLGLSRATRAELTSGSAAQTFATSVLIPAAAAAHGAALGARYPSAPAPRPSVPRPSVPRRPVPPPGRAETPGAPGASGTTSVPRPPGDRESSSPRQSAAPSPGDDRPSPAEQPSAVRPAVEQPAAVRPAEPPLLEPLFLEPQPTSRPSAPGSGGPQTAAGFASAVQRSWRYAGHLRHVVAERFGMETSGLGRKTPAGEGR